MLPHAIQDRMSPVNHIMHSALTGKSDPVLAFQGWLDEAMRQIVLGINGSWLLPYVRSATDVGVMHARSAAEGRPSASETPADRTHILQSLAITELQGIIEATSQRVVRAFANGYLSKKSPSAITTDCRHAVDAVGVQRGRLLASFMVVRSHAAATLDGFRARGISRVGLVPERLPPAPMIGDAVFPSRKVVRAENKLRRQFGEGGVDVMTAGDDAVCDECNDIADNGPYSLDEAESLIPAHVRCRCTFVPADDDVGDAGFDEDVHPRDKSGKWTAADVSEAEELYSDYEHGSLIKAASAGQKAKAGDFAGGAAIDAVTAAKVNKAADVLNSMASTSSGHKEVWRGLVLPKGANVKDVFKHNSVHEFEGLTATSRDKSVALKYTDPQFIGEDEGEKILLRIEHKTGIPGHNSQSGELAGAETLLPHGAKYRVTGGSYKEGDVTVVRLYNSGKSIKDDAEDIEDAGFDEDVHPRDDHGRWTEAGGGKFAKVHRDLHKQGYEYVGIKGGQHIYKDPEGLSTAEVPKSFPKESEGDIRREFSGTKKVAEEQLKISKDTPIDETVQTKAHFKALAASSLGRELEPKEHDALKDYMEVSSDISGQLRSGKLSASSKKLVAELDKVVGGSLLSKPVTAYRVVDKDTYDTVVKSKSYSDKAFVSTTTNPKGLLAGGDDTFSGGKLLRVEISKGAAALPVAHLGKFSEREIILARNTKFDVTIGKDKIPTLTMRKRTAKDSATHIAAGVIITADNTGRTLFVRRSGTGDQAGTWAFPGGAVEPGETVEQAAARETREEIGYDPANDLEEGHRGQTNGVDFTTYMHTTAREFRPHLNGEHDAYKWALIEQTPEPLHPGVARTLDEMDAALRMRDSGFDEDQHPRDKNGQWTSGGFESHYEHEEPTFGDKKEELKRDLQKSLTTRLPIALDDLTDHLSHTEVSADEFMSKLVPLPTDGRPVLKYDEDRNLSIVTSLTDENGMHIANMQRSLNFADKTATHRELVFKDTQTGTGRAKDILRSQIDLYKRLGIEKVNLHANVNVGGYAWAKYGFTPDEFEWKNTLHKTLSSRLEGLSHATSIEKSALKKLIYSDDPKSVWAIADSKHGKDLLLDSDWYGSLNMKDAASMQRFHSYVDKGHAAHA